MYNIANNGLWCTKDADLMLASVLILLQNCNKVNFEDRPTDRQTDLGKEAPSRSLKSQANNWRKQGGINKFKCISKSVFKPFQMDEYDKFNFENDL